MKLIWATRGKDWGFRFLLDGGFEDPLREYDRYFAGVGDELSAYHRDGDTVALRFPDPDGRRDSSGRVIPHEFVVYTDGSLYDAAWIYSVQEGFDNVWPDVKDTFARVWDKPDPSWTAS